MFLLTAAAYSLAGACPALCSLLPTGINCWSCWSCCQLLALLSTADASTPAACPLLVLLPHVLADCCCLFSCWGLPCPVFFAANWYQLLVLLVLLSAAGLAVNC